MERFRRFGADIVVVIADRGGLYFIGNYLNCIMYFTESGSRADPIGMPDCLFGTAAFLHMCVLETATRIGPVECHAGRVFVRGQWGRK